MKNPGADLPVNASFQAKPGFFPFASFEGQNDNEVDAGEETAIIAQRFDRVVKRFVSFLMEYFTTKYRRLDPEPCYNVFFKRMDNVIAGQGSDEKEYRIKITRNGPYIVTGGVPLSEQIICQDSEGHSHGWREGKVFDVPNTYTLCRCGKSKNKPFCDGSHFRSDFDGTETANRATFSAQSVEVVGPGLTLSEVPVLCAEARFCQRAGDTWSLVKRSDDQECRRIAIEEAGECPSGRIVLKDKNGNIIEPELPPSIGLVEDEPAGFSGPIWVRGGIPTESADGFEYEQRNRVTLCRCGHSKNKPFCDGSHLEIKFKSSE